MKKIAIVGAGPGGLTAGMILSHRGHQVDVYEKHPGVGGRNGRLTLGEEGNQFHFDIGPTFLMMPQVLEEVFKAAGRNMNDVLDLKKVDPMYRLRFPGKVDFEPTQDKEKMVKEISRVFPGEEKNFFRYIETEGKKFSALYPCLRVPYINLKEYFSSRFLCALPRVDFLKSVYSRLSTYFQREEMRIAMTFQAKYLGMSPWNCPATFTILSYIEHQFGVFHPIGGLNAISRAMAQVIEENGGKVHTSTPVKKILIENKRATGLELESGEKIKADAVVINADFAHAMTHLVDEKDRPKWNNRSIAKKKYSCSTFMIYLGLKKKYDLPHHTIVFADDYRGNVEEISDTKTLPQDPSFYVQNAVVTDPTLAPEGKSAMYILVPVANLEADTDWDEKKKTFRDLVLKKIAQKLDLHDLEENIEHELVATPLDWSQSGGVYRGAVFNLAHIPLQMLSFRPRNKFEEFDSCYLVGGGTHPGSGLPTIYESGRICADLIQTLN